MGEESTQYCREVTDETDAPQSQPDPLVGSGSRTDAWLHWLYLHGDRRIVSGLLLAATPLIRGR